jgi:hypothetical protein
MSRTLQFKRLANTHLGQVIGANGEIIVDYTNDTLTVHDGQTLGGSRLATERYTNTSIVLANAAFLQANSASGLARSAFDSANINYAFTQVLATNITLAYNQANTGTVLAQAAFTQANTSAQTVPQNAQTVNYTIQLTDAGKHIYYTQSTNTILYIPTTANVAFSNGSTIMIISRTSSSANVTVSPNTGVSMYLAGNTTSASRNVTTYGMASLIQVAANTWFISGTGVV